MVLFYVVNFNDDARKKRMIHRFRQADIDLHFVDPVHENDDRIKYTSLYKRTSAIMLQHLDSLRHFYENTSAEHCVVCEDDIHISRDIGKDMPGFIQTFQELELDVLLMGYLWPYPVDGENAHFPVLKDDGKYKFHGYPDDIWGCQMYLISRKHAKYILDTFTIEFAILQLEKVHYNPDWTITKYGKRALVAPMVAVEEGEDKSGHVDQTDFHQRCHMANFNADTHI